MIRLFKVFIPVGTLTLLVSEVLLVTSAFIFATYLILEVDPTVFLLYDGGLSRIALVVLSILVGLHFHDLRNNHSTWLIEDGVPEVAQAKRLGHRLPGVRGIYSHVSATVEQRLVAGLQTRWEQNRSPFRADNLGN